MSPNKKFNLKVAFVGILLIAISGAAYLMFSSAATVSDCGSTTVSNYDYDVPFGNAVWNQKVCDLPRHPQSGDYASRFYHYGNRRSPEDQSAPHTVLLRSDVNYDDPAGSYSMPVYYASDATTTKKVFTSSNSPSNLDGVKSIYSSDWDRKKMEPDTPIPWNSSWTAGLNLDAVMIILDESNGRIYEISGKQSWCIISSKVCVGTATIGRNEVTGEIIDYRTYEGPLKRRGVGLSYLAGLVTAEEVLAGEIRHAVSVGIPNVAKAPECTVLQQGNYHEEGRTCGVAVAPATKFEWVDPNRGGHPTTVSPYDATYNNDQGKLIPEGMRFALDISNQEIEDWIASQSKFSGKPRLAETARIYARALRDYGFMINDTSGGASVQDTGSLNDAERARWKQLGMDDSKSNKLLENLITEDNMYVVDTPTVTCEDGAESKYYCIWTEASYEGSTTPPPDTQMPTVSITSPGDDSTVKGTINVSANASDNVAVSKVEFYVDSQLKATSTSSPYSFSLDTTKLTDSSHTIEAKAYDSSGNVRNVAVTVTVDNTIPQPQVVCDFDGDEIVGLADLARLILEYNNNVSPYNNGDCDGNGYVNLADLAILILNYDS